jgi:hypothetical protein
MRSMSERSLYEVLGVSETASSDEIKAAYKRLLHTVHPDVGGNSALFDYVRSAYLTLSDPQRRARYDHLRAAAAPPPPQAPPAPAPTPWREPRRRGRKLAGVLGVGLAVSYVVGLAIDDQPVRVSDVAAKVAPEPQTAPPSVAPVVAQPAPPVQSPDAPAPPSEPVRDVLLGEVRAAEACRLFEHMFSYAVPIEESGDVFQKAANEAQRAALADFDAWQPLRDAMHSGVQLYMSVDSDGDAVIASFEEIGRLCDRFIDPPE